MTAKPKPQTNTEIRTTAEETDCPNCGAPLYLGDRAYFDKTEMYCTRKCAEEYCADPNPYPSRK
jgi:lipoate synthase